MKTPNLTCDAESRTLDSLMMLIFYCFIFVGYFHSLLRELVAEFTLAENPSLTTTSLLRTVCHKDDTILLGTWLQETDHKSVEEQVGYI